MDAFDIKECTVLVVDDSQMIRTLLLRHLRQGGYKSVLEATNGQEALELLAEHPVDLVLLDINMPVMDGYATLEKIKSDDRWREVSVIMITAVDKIESVARCIQFGAEDYMPKLFNPILLDARIIASLEKRYLKRQVQELQRELGKPR
jgi:DNA-binding response OmpR family regulator